MTDLTCVGAAESLTGAEICARLLAGAGWSRQELRVARGPQVVFLRVEAGEGWELVPCHKLV